MGARKAAIDVQAEVRRGVRARVAAARAARPKPGALPKPETSEAIVAARIEARGQTCYLCRPEKAWWFASTPHLERAFRFATLEDAEDACRRGGGLFQPVLVTIKATFRRPDPDA